MTCRYDREAEAYLTEDGKPCRTDDYGDPTHHCTARRTCSQHVGVGEVTCARCLGRARMNLRRLPTLDALMPAAAVEAGIESEAASLAGPSAHPGAWASRRVAMRAHLAHWERTGRITEHQHLHARATMEDDDDLDPYMLLGRWERMLREDYSQPGDKPITVSSAAAYLDGQLGRLAQDPEQDFPLFAREVRACRSHMEAQLAVLQVKPRGAPCPECTSEETGVGPRLMLEHPHWCEDPECCREHYSVIVDPETSELMPDTRADRWVCPRDRRHEWDAETYSRWIEERRATRRGA